MYGKMRIGKQNRNTCNDNWKESDAAPTSLIFHNYRGKVHLLDKIRRVFGLTREWEWEIRIEIISKGNRK